MSVRKPTRQMIIFFFAASPEQEHGINGDECWYNLLKRCFRDSSDLFVELDVAAVFKCLLTLQRRVKLLI